MYGWLVICLVICDALLCSGRSVLNQNCPTICVCQEFVTNCGNRNLTELPDNIDNNVISLNLSHNNFYQFPFKRVNFSSLNFLNLAHNYIGFLDHEAFTMVPYLSTLDLSHNNFKDWRDIVSSAFDNLRQLTELDLSHNSFGGRLSFHNVPSLRVLKLNRCNIRNIDSLLDRRDGLVEVHLAHNKIDSITSNLSSITLEHLDLTNCNIANISQTAFSGLTNLNTLLLNKNSKLQTFNVDTVYAKKLDMVDSSLEQIPQGNFPNLESVNFAGNKITEIKTFQKFVTTNILALNMSFNSIKKVYNGAFYTIQCSVIDLSYNRITYIEPNLFSTQTELISLNLSHNFLNKIAWSINTVKYLDVSFNEIKTLDANDFQDMYNIEILKLSRNFITKIPDNIYLPSAVTLDVSNCRLRSINNLTFARMDRLRILDISDNQLTTISPAFISKIREITLYNNPWRCDCDKLKQMYESIGYGNDDILICDSPEKFEGQTWLQACKDEWYPGGIIHKKDNLWIYSLGILTAMSIVLIVLITMRRIARAKAERLRREEAERRAEAEEALRRMQRAHREAREEANRNAPDPREAQGPPSYIEALQFPKLDSSHPSLNGSMHSIASRQTLTGGSNPDLSKRNSRRRKRRRRKSSDEERPASQLMLDSETSDRELTRQPREPLESDF
ncbi:insulin-like growth factor-binding protein complex acid labile subunit [Aethina tumida]|uniref:insulin-like growth factor-binding protein complex acid labile subunit n=1 Tax=Aethina tumida TaxID=116153 RepID=UPI002148DA6C|nr:insulin-like growth factor-binding protein complex acid labile subunit [Aethina tumida]